MSTQTDASPYQLWLTQQLSIEFHKRHRAFCEGLELVEKFLAGTTALAPVALLGGVLPESMRGSWIALTLAALVAALTFFCVLWNPTRKGMIAERHQEQWEELQRRFPTKASIAAALAGYLVEKARIVGEPRLTALTNDAMLDVCLRQGLDIPAAIERPALLRRWLMHVF